MISFLAFKFLLLLHIYFFTVLENQTLLQYYFLLPYYYISLYFPGGIFYGLYILSLCHFGININQHFVVVPFLSLHSPTLGVLFFPQVTHARDYL